MGSDTRMVESRRRAFSVVTPAPWNILPTELLKRKQPGSEGRFGLLMLQKLVPQGFRIKLAILLKEKRSDFEIVLALINPGNEEILNLENLEPTSDTNEDYTQISHYQKSGYSVQVMEQKPIKKVSEKNVVDKSLQTDSKVSIFRRKEIMDESEQTNISARTSSVTPFKKQLQPNSPQLQDQESYCNNQQPVAYQPLQTPKSFQEEIIFPEETEIKKACVQESGYGTKQVEKYDSQQIKTQVKHHGSQDINRLESQHSCEQAICVQKLPNKTCSQGQPLNKERTWISERTGQRTSTGSYQQTSIVWDPETLAELLLPFHQSMLRNNSEKEPLNTESLLTFSGASEMKPLLQESQHSTQQLQGQELEQISQRHIVQESCRCIQQSEGQELGRDSQSVGVQDSQYSIQQPEEQESRHDTQCVAVQDSWHGIQTPEGQESRRSSCSAVVQESQHSIRQPEGQESKRSSQSVAVQESWHSIQQPEGQESRRGSRSVAVQESWHSIQKQQGQESKQASQQATEQESQDINKKSDGQESKQDSQQPAVPESQYNIQEPKIFGGQQETQLRGQQVETEKTKSEGKKPKRRRKIRKIKIDQAQQTDSTQSLKREFLEKSLQTETISIAKIRTQLGMQESHHGSHQYDLQKTGKPVISDLCIDSLPEKQQDFQQGSKPIDSPELCSCSLTANLSDVLPDSQQIEVHEFRHSGLPLEDQQVHRPSVGLKEFEHDSHQLKKKDTQSDKLFELRQKSQRGSLGTENKTDDAKEPYGAISSENRTMPLKQNMSFGQQTYSIISLEETTWLNRRSGKLMQNHSQQTNDSWLQNYRENKQKIASKEALSKSNEPRVQKSQRISSESGTNEQYTALETRRSGEEAVVLESHEDSKHSPSLESQKRTSKQPSSLEAEKASELPAISDSWKAKQSFVPEFQTNGEQFAMLYSQKDGGQVTIPEYQRHSNDFMGSEFGKSREVSATVEFQKGNEEPTLSEFPKATEYPTPPNSQWSSEVTLSHVSERCSEKYTLSESLRASEEPESQMTNEPPNIMQLHRTSEQPLASESKTSELFHEKWEANEPSLLKSQGAVEFSNIPYSRRASAPPSVFQSQNASELPNLPQSRRASEALASQRIPESHFVPGFQKADLPPVFESQRDSEQPISSESEMGSEYPPLLDFRKGSGQPAIPESSESNEQPICPESQKFDEPAVSESQNNSEQPTIPKFQRDSDHPYELEPPKGSEQLTVSESERDSKQPAIPEPQRSTESLIESRCRKDSMKPDVSETQRCSESLIMPKSQRDSEQAIMPESWSVSQQSTTLLPQWESKQPVVVEAEHQLVADKVNKAGDNILESNINDSKQKPSCASKAQQTYSIISVGTNTWKNRKTGKLMTCSSQQTERSWLQEHRARKENLTPKGSSARKSTPEEKKMELDKINHVEDDRKEMIAQQDNGKDESQPENQMAAAAALIKEKDIISFESNEAEKELQESCKEEPIVENQQEKLLQSQRGHLQEDALIDGVPKPEVLASQLSGQEMMMLASKVAEVVEYCQPSQHADLPFQHPEVTTSQPDSQQTEIAVSKQVSQQAVLTVSQQASKEAEVPESQQASQKRETSQQASKQIEVPASQQANQQIETSRQASKQVEMEERMALQISSKLDVEQEFHQGSKQSVKHEFHYNDILWSTPSNDAQQSYESASRSTLDSSSSYVEGEDEALQTYSRISLENGVWLNRKTGKVLINHSQQTSMSLLNKTALKGNGKSASCPKPPISDVKLNESKFDQQTCSSNKPSEMAVSDLSIQESWDEVQSIDEVEKVLVSHVSTNILSTQTLAYVEMQYEATATYDSLYMPKGSWINLKTGKMLVSQYQQTDESSFQKSKEDIQPVRHPSYTPELSYYDLSDIPVIEGSQQTCSDADMPDG